MSSSSSLSRATPEVRGVLEAVLSGHELGLEEALVLAVASGDSALALHEVADGLRQAQAGELVTYVVNRNINFTNVCVKGCRFCAFSRHQRSEQGYFLDQAEVVRRALEAQHLGATEVCLQAGLAPSVTGRSYVALCQALARAAPHVHIHAFSPEEIKFGASRDGVPIRALLAELKQAGLGSLPGTSAEILDDDVRRRIAPGRISTAEWVDIIRTAHELGIPTTSTMMFGHVETWRERIQHLLLLRSIQRQTGGFTEFVPLSFVPHHTPMGKKRQLPGLQLGPSSEDVFRVHALARVLLGAHIRNIQVSWVKEGLAQATALLGVGANDLGGTLMNESISTAAGSAHGQRTAPRELRAAARRAGRTPAERRTNYEISRIFTGTDDPSDPLDGVSADDQRFGSYASLIADSQHQYSSRPQYRLPIRR